MSKLVRIILATVLAIAGVVVMWPSFPIGGHSFDGAIMIVPAQADMDLFAEITYQPESDSSLQESEDGTISLSVSDMSTGTQTSYWYVLMSGDAWLTNPEYVDADGETREAPFIVNSNLSTGEGQPVDIQVFQIASTERSRLVGTPQESPLSKLGDQYSLTMPKAVSLDPVEGSPREGGVLLAEGPMLAILAANTDLPVSGGWQGWNYPRTTTFMLNSGLSETDTVSVTRSAPELDRDKWGQLVVWTVDHPVEASAIFSDTAASAASTARSSWSFLLFGAALPLLLEGLASRRQKTQVRAVAAVVDTPHVEIPAQHEPPAPAALKKAPPKNKGKRRNRKRKRD